MRPVNKSELKSQLRRFGSFSNLDERIEYAHNTNNNLVEPSLLLEKSKFFGSMDIDIEDYVQEAWGFGTPVKGQGYLPHKGDINILVLVFSFGSEYMNWLGNKPYYPDGMIYPGQTIEAVERAFNGFGNPDEYPYESLRNYYLRSSYGKCRIKADVYGWIPLPDFPFGWYDSDGDGINDYWRQNYYGSGDVLQWFFNNSPLVDEIDWAKYDNDHDGYVDGLYLIWNYNDLGWGSGWWPQQQTINPITLDNVTLKTCVWSWYSRLNYNQRNYDPHSDIHETGHLLGLPDLYDYYSNVGVSGGVGGLDMMDYNWGDHNAWHKFLLNWIKPTIIFPFRNVEPKTVELHPSSTHPEAVIIMPNSSQIDPYNDLFMVEYRKAGRGNDPKDVIGEGGNITEGRWDFPNDGLLIWHVDATLNSNNGYFGYDNSAAPHKYLKLMEADGLNQIQLTLPADAGDFWEEGMTFDDYSNPNAWLYNFHGGEGRCPSGVKVDQIGPAGESMSARYQIIRN